MKNEPPMPRWLIVLSLLCVGAAVVYCLVTAYLIYRENSELNDKLRKKAVENFDYLERNKK